MKLISGNSNLDLSKRIADATDISLSAVKIGRFADGEVRVEINDNMRGQDVFIIQSTSSPVNDNLMELLVMIDALKRASARRITAVIPYFGYARQDRKTMSRAPISAKLVADLLTSAGASRVLTVDLHAGQIQGFFNIPVDTLIARPVLIDDIKNQVNGEQLVFVSPDAGGTERARGFAKKFDTEIAVIDKRRPEPGASQVMHVVGDVEGRECLIVDDICDSAGTLCHAAQALLNNGATGVKAYITHGVLTPAADDRIYNSVLKEIVVTDSIKPARFIEIDKIRYVSIGSLIGKAIMNIHNERSVSSLLVDDNWKN
jgi:ribose-phosphate pyrophosphokinase